MTAMLIGIDAGTTNVKVALIDESGHQLAVRHAPFVVLQPRPGWHEIDAESWWTGIVAGVRGVVRDAGADPQQVVAIGLSGIGGSPVTLGSDGRPLAPVPTWADTRSASQVAERRHLADRVLRGSGSPLGEWAFVPKLWWWQEHDPALFARIDKVVEPPAHLVQRMTGDLRYDVHCGPFNYVFNLREARWDADLAGDLDVPMEILPELVAPLTPAGDGLTAAAAEELGLRAGTTVVNCGGDPIPISLALGAYRPGQAFLHTGTGANFGVLNDGALWHEAFLSQMHIAPRLSYLAGLIGATGASLQWLRDTFLGAAVDASRALGGELGEYELMSELASRSPRGANGLIFLPYLFGRQSPSWDPDMRAAFLGLGPHVTRADLVRAVMEGVAYETAANVPLLAELGIEIGEVFAGGGPNRSATWNQIYADVLGIPLVTASTDGDAAIGCAWMAGIAAGLFAGTEDVVERFVRIKARYEPDPDRHAFHREVRATLDELYPHLQKAQRRF